MKKMLLATAVLLAVSSVNAQKLDTKRLRLGVTLSPVFTSMKAVENGVEKQGSRMGFTYGFVAEIPFKENYALVTGLQATSTGGTLKYTRQNTWDGKYVGYLQADNNSNTNTATYEFKMQHVELPLAAKLSMDGGDKLKYYGMFGAKLGVLVKGRSNAASNFAVGGVNYTSENENIIGKLQPVNIGMLIGAGVEYQVTDNNAITAGIEYNNGFIDVTRNSAFGNDGRVNNY